MATLQNIGKDLRHWLNSDSQLPEDHFWSAIGVDPGDEWAKFDLWEKSKRELAHIAKPPMPPYLYALFIICGGSVLLPILNVPYSVGRDLTFVAPSIAGGILYFVHKRQEYSEAVRNHLALSLFNNAGAEECDGRVPTKYPSENLTPRKRMLWDQFTAAKDDLDKTPLQRQTAHRMLEIIAAPNETHARKERVQHELDLLDALDRKPKPSEPNEE